MIHIPIEQRYDKRNQMFHSSAFAIAAGVVGVAGAAASAGMSMYSAGRAAKAQGAAAKKAQRQQNKALKGFTQGQQQIEADLGQVPMPVFNLGEDIAGARDISAYYREELEKFLPGAAAQREKGTQQLNQAMDVIGTYLRGEIPQDVKDQLMRNIAEMGGAGFAPAAAGRGAFVQGPQANLARSLGLTSLDIQGRGLTAAPQIQASAQNWQQLAKAFTAEPLDVSRMSLAYQMGGADVGLKKAGIRSDLLAAQFGAQTGISQKQYAMQQENIQTSLARDQALAQGIGDVSSALSSGVGGVGSAYGKLATAKAAAGGFNYGQTAFGAGGGSVGGMGTYGPNYGMPSGKV
jgi:hypothetical protein